MMLQSRRGSEDGFSVKMYEEGKEYDVADTLARRFIAQGWATEKSDGGLHYGL